MMFPIQHLVSKDVPINTEANQDGNLGSRVTTLEWVSLLKSITCAFKNHLLCACCV